MNNIPNATSFIEDLNFCETNTCQDYINEIITRTRYREEKFVLLHKIPYTIFKMTPCSVRTPLHAIYSKYSIDEITDNQVFFSTIEYYPLSAVDKNNEIILRHVIDILCIKNDVCITFIIKLMKIVFTYKYDDLISKVIKLYFDILLTFDFYNAPLCVATDSIPLFPYIIRYATDDQVYSFIDFLNKDKALNSFIWKDVEPVFLERYDKNKIDSWLNLSNLSM